MAQATSGELAASNAQDGGHGQGVASPFKVSRLSKTPDLNSNPCNLPTTKPQELREQLVDSGYGSASSTPDRQDTATPPRRPIQNPLIRQAGLFVSNKAMDHGTRQRFRQVHLQVEKMLLEFMRKFKSVQGRQEPVSIRPMMLGKTDADVDAKAYMVVLCPENTKSKMQGFFNDPLIKSLREPGDDDIPSFKVLVIGHPLKLRASTSHIRVQCGSMNDLYNGTETFCGTPICLSDEFGHSRNATFGGVVKVTFNDGEHHLYGLTAGHMIKRHGVVANERAPILDILSGEDPVDLDLGEVVLKGTTQDQAAAELPTTNGDIRGDDRNEWDFFNKHDLGTVISAIEDDDLEDEQQSLITPYRDWALFELNAYRPNQIGFHGRRKRKGDLRLKSPATHDGGDDVFVHMLCASQGIKYGVLSTTCARVLLDSEHSFTDAYTLSLEGSKVSDGDCGSWVVDESRLEVYGHVVADDIFGDAYVIPMNDILTDVRRYLGARSVDLPTVLDFIPKVTQQQPQAVGLLAEPILRSKAPSQVPSAESAKLSQNRGKRLPISGERSARGYSARDPTTASVNAIPMTTSSSPRPPTRTISKARRKNVRFDDIASHSGSSSSSSSIFSKTGVSSSSTSSDYSKPEPEYRATFYEQQALKQALQDTVRQVDEWKAKVLDIERQLTKKLRQADANLQAVKSRCENLEDETKELQRDKKKLRDANKSLEARLAALQVENEGHRINNETLHKKLRDSEAHTATTSFAKGSQAPPGLASRARRPVVYIEQGSDIQPSQVDRSPYTDTMGPKVLENGTIPAIQQYKRPRRRHEGIERMYKCEWNGCENSYSTLKHLNDHIIMQSHGQRRIAEGPPSNVTIEREGSTDDNVMTININVSTTGGTGSIQ